MTGSAHRLLAAVLLLGGLLAIPSPARAAETYDTCVDFIESLPATISQQGVWCLRKNLATNITSGNAITIAANNVTIDCNGFKIGGLAAGNGSGAVGIRANNMQNATVRNCSIRGFDQGIQLFGGAGHLVEDNRLDNNLSIGIQVSGDNNLIRRNRIYDTGGRTDRNYAYGIFAYAGIEDNVVSGLFADASGGNLQGIVVYGVGANVRDNAVSGFDLAAVTGGNVAAAAGIVLADLRQRASGNQVVGGASSDINGVGIVSNTGSNSYCQDNAVGGFDVNISPDCISSGNLTPP